MSLSKPFAANTCRISFIASWNLLAFVSDIICDKYSIDTVGPASFINLLTSCIVIVSGWLTVALGYLRTNSERFAVAFFNAAPFVTPSNVSYHMVLPSSSLTEIKASPNLCNGTYGLLI